MSLTAEQLRALEVVRGLNDADSPAHRARRVFGTMSANRSNRTDEYSVAASVGDALVRRGLLRSDHHGRGRYAYSITESGRAALRAAGHHPPPGNAPRSIDNYSALVEQLLVRDYGFSAANARFAVRSRHRSLVESMHDADEFASSAAIRIAELSRRAPIDVREARGGEVASAEVRYEGWSYRAVMYDEWVGSYAGATRRTEYFRFDGAWRPVSWDSIPGPAYRRLRAALHGAPTRGRRRR